MSLGNDLAQWAKHLALSLMNRVQATGFTWWERTGSPKLSPDLHTCAVASECAWASKHVGVSAQETPHTPYKLNFILTCPC